MNGILHARPVRVSSVVTAVILAGAVTLAEAGPVVGQSAPAADPDRVVLAPTGDRARVTVTGERTDAFTGVEVVDSSGRAARGITARIRGNTGSQLTLEIGSRGAAVGSYGIRLVSSRGSVDVDFTLVVEREDAPPTVERVLGPSSAALGEPVSLEVEASDDGQVVGFEATWAGGTLRPRIDGPAPRVRETLEIEGLEAGTQRIQIVAVDDAGNRSPARAVEVQVEASSFSARTVTAGEFQLTVDPSSPDAFEPRTVGAGDFQLTVDPSSPDAFEPVTVGAGDFQLTVEQPASEPPDSE